MKRRSNTWIDEMNRKSATGDVVTKKYHKGHKVTKAKGCFGAGSKQERSK